MDPPSGDIAVNRVILIPLVAGINEEKQATRGEMTGPWTVFRHARRHSIQSGPLERHGPQSRRYKDAFRPP